MWMNENLHRYIGIIRLKINHVDQLNSQFLKLKGLIYNFTHKVSADLSYIHRVYNLTLSVQVFEGSIQEAENTFPGSNSSAAAAS